MAVSRKLVDIAEAAGLNPGRIAERALRRELSEALSDDSNEAARREQLRREIDAEVAWYNAYVEEHGLFADDWRTFWCANLTCSRTRAAAPPKPFRS